MPVILYSYLKLWIFLFKKTETRLKWENLFFLNKFVYKNKLFNSIFVYCNNFQRVKSVGSFCKPLQSEYRKFFPNILIRVQGISRNWVNNVISIVPKAQVLRVGLTRRRFENTLLRGFFARIYLSCDEFCPTEHTYKVSFL